jgi:hypothetical protein
LLFKVHRQGAHQVDLLFSPQGTRSLTARGPKASLTAIQRPKDEFKRPSRGPETSLTAIQRRRATAGGEFNGQPEAQAPQASAQPPTERLTNQEPTQGERGSKLFTNNSLGAGATKRKSSQTPCRSSAPPGTLPNQRNTRKQVKHPAEPSLRSGIKHSNV